MARVAVAAFAIVLALCSALLSIAAALDATCSFRKSPLYKTGPPERSSDKLNVHLVPHTHDDVGWCVYWRFGVTRSRFPTEA